jgi:predicted DNA-binding transcriptional regulator YafY
MNAEIDATSAMTVRIVYTNYRGETASRTILPMRLEYASTEWHPDPQWLMIAYDFDRNAERSFALGDIVKWERE